MTILVSHQAIPPHYTTKLRPRLQNLVATVVIINTVSDLGFRKFQSSENELGCLFCLY